MHNFHFKNKKLYCEKYAGGDSCLLAGKEDGL